MKPTPAHRKTLATAWVVLALGVSGTFMINRHPETRFHPRTEGAPEQRVFKSRHRDSTDPGPTRSHCETVRILAARRSSTERDQALIHAVSQWADEAPEDAAAWLDRFPQGELHDWLACAMVTAMAEHDPAKAGSHIESQMGEGLPRTHAIVAVAQRWAQRSPDAARQWLARLASPSGKTDALREIAVMEAEASRVLLPR